MQDRIYVSLSPVRISQHSVALAGVFYIYLTVQIRSLRRDCAYGQHWRVLIAEAHSSKRLGHNRIWHSPNGVGGSHLPKYQVSCVPAAQRRTSNAISSTIAPLCMPAARVFARTIHRHNWTLYTRHFLTLQKYSFEIKMPGYAIGFYAWQQAVSNHNGLSNNLKHSGMIYDTVL